MGVKLSSWGKYVRRREMNERKLEKSGLSHKDAFNKAHQMERDRRTKSIKTKR